MKHTGWNGHGGRYDVRNPYGQYRPLKKLRLFSFAHEWPNGRLENEASGAAETSAYHGPGPHPKMA